MRKLTMDLDALNVQSFVTEAAGPLGFGTVHGRQKENSGPETVCTLTVECRDTEARTCEKGCAETTLCTAVGGPCKDDDGAKTTLCTKVGGC
jgi:hypothetical protein